VYEKLGFMHLMENSSTSWEPLANSKESVALQVASFRVPKIVEIDLNRETNTSFGQMHSPKE
jgi:hypothetical protein